MFYLHYRLLQRHFKHIIDPDLQRSHCNSVLLILCGMVASCKNIIMETLPCVLILIRVAVENFLYILYHEHLKRKWFNMMSK